VLERGDRGEHPLALGGQPQPTGAQALGQRGHVAGVRVRGGHGVQPRSVSNRPVAAEAPDEGVLGEAGSPSDAGVSCRVRGAHRNGIARPTSGAAVSREGIPHRARHGSIGGAGLAAAAVELGLVDELRLFRDPVVIGGGTPFLPPVTEDVPLDLIETRPFGSRVVYERYRRVRDGSD
jgi:hypothetical protein